MSCNSAVRSIPSCRASAACSLELRPPQSAGSKSFNRKCLPLSTREVLASLPVFILSYFLSICIPERSERFLPSSPLRRLPARYVQNVPAEPRLHHAPTDF